MSEALKIVNAVLDGISPKEWFKQRWADRDLKPWALKAGFVQVAKGWSGADTWQKDIPISDTSMCVVAIAGPLGSAGSGYLVSVRVINIDRTYPYRTPHGAYARHYAFRPTDRHSFFALVGRLADSADPAEYWDNVEGYVEKLERAWDSFTEMARRL